VRSPSDFERLIKLLKPFPLISTTRETYLLAARLRNHCRRKGIQASPVDFLITAVCVENGYPLLTSDRDFLLISRHSDLALLTA
jgi:predicted nucleic acid-binding protein